jgi:hypothetical protein
MCNGKYGARRERMEENMKIKSERDVEKAVTRSRIEKKRK